VSSEGGDPGSDEEACGTYHRVAEYYAKDGFFLKALAVFKQILKLDPGCVPVYLRLAEVYRRMGLHSESLKQYQAVVRYYEEQGLKKESLDVMRTMMTLVPDDLATREKLADLYAKEGFTSEAIDQYRQIARRYEEKGLHEEACATTRKLRALG